MKLSLAALLFLASTLPAHPQSTPPPPGTVFDVVSIRLNNSGTTNLDIDNDDDLFVASNIRLKRMLQIAYDIHENLISGITGPVESAHFDVTAKVVDPDKQALRRMTPEQRRAMYLPFLKDRFQVKAHTEIRTLPVYDLVLLPGDLKFKPSPADQANDSSTSVRNFKMEASGLSMSALAKKLGDYAGRTVIDKTGLTGVYTLTLSWTPDNLSEARPDGPPTLFTALTEQLGLKLVPARGPVETLVVDHAEMPSEN